MTLEEIVRRKALAEPLPLSWACDHLAMAVRLLKATRADLEGTAAEPRGFLIAIEQLIVATTENPPMPEEHPVRVSGQFMRGDI